MIINGRRDSASREKLEQLLVDVEGEFNWGLAQISGLEQLEIFESENINCPEFTNCSMDAEEWVNKGLLVYGRNLYHTQGRDIVGPAHRKFIDKDYYVQVIPIADEWRIHVFNGQCIARGLKVQVGPPILKLPLRNRRNGWNMVHCAEPPKGVRTLAKRMVEALGYLYGACDIIVDPAGCQWALEVNTRPGLDDYTAAAYAKAIRNY